MTASNVGLPDRKVEMSQLEKEINELKLLISRFLHTSETKTIADAQGCCAKLSLAQFGIVHCSSMVRNWQDGKPYPYYIDEQNTSWPEINPKNFETEFAKMIAQRASCPMYECTDCGNVYTQEEAAKLPEDADYWNHENED